jgi:hypothetical protein
MNPALACGWSEEDIISLLTPKKQPNDAINLAGWSPDTLMHAISPQVGTKRNPVWITPQRSLSSPGVTKKAIDIKETPSPVPVRARLASESTAEEVDHLSQTLAGHSLSHSSTTFRSARSCLRDDQERVDYAAAAFELDEPLQNGWRLYDFQKVTIRQCLSQERTILALDMGLGKTVISLLWAKLTCEFSFQKNPDSLPIVTIVICPCTLVSNWEREATAIGFRCGKMNEKTSSITDPSSSLPLLLVSWTQIPSPDSVLSRLAARLPQASHPRSLQRDHSSHAFPSHYLLIADEAHAMQTVTSQRTQSAIRLCLHPACRGVVLATGTPMKNGRPANILPLLIALRHPLGRNRAVFEKRYCDAKKTRFCAWDTSGATNLEELREKIGSSLIRKTKEECLPELPKLCRVRIKAVTSDAVQRGYQDILNRYKVQKQKQRQVSSSGLEMVTELRQYISAAKVCSSH